MVWMPRLFGLLDPVSIYSEWEEQNWLTNCWKWLRFFGYRSGPQWDLTASAQLCLHPFHSNLKWILGKFLCWWSSIGTIHAGKWWNTSLSLEVLRKCVTVGTWLGSGPGSAGECLVSIFQPLCFNDSYSPAQACRSVSVCHTPPAQAAQAKAVCAKLWWPVRSPPLLLVRAPICEPHKNCLSVPSLVPFTFTNAFIRCSKILLWINPSPLPKPLVKLVICLLDIQQVLIFILHFPL